MADLLAAHAGEQVEPADPEPGDPALLTYTSGTTGVSKGAVNTHRAVVHNAEMMTRWYRLGPGDVTVAMAPLFHITGLICHLATARASLTPLLLCYRFEPGEFLRLVERWRGSYVIGPLTAFIAMLEHPELAERDLSSLTKVASGGAPVNPAAVERWEQATGAYVHNSYGLTESAAPSPPGPGRARAPRSTRRAARSRSACRSPAPRRRSSIIEDAARAGARRDRRDRRPRPGGHPRLLAAPGGDARARCATAGCTPATSACATPTAGSTSSTGSRT